MMEAPFRLSSVKIEDKTLATKNIDLVDSNKSSIGNHYTLIIGNNGTGKSRLLSGIARYFMNVFNAEKGRSLFEDGFDYELPPSRVIAVTNSIADKFPNDETFRMGAVVSKNRLLLNTKYNYLGTRNNANAFSGKALMNRAISILFNNLSRHDVLNSYRYLFEYLGYAPVIKVEYKVANPTRRFSKDQISINSFIEHVRNKTKNTRYNSSFLKGFEKNYANKIEDLCLLLNKIYQSDGNSYSINISFSENKLAKLDSGIDDYASSVDEYESLTILEKLDFVRSFNVKTYKSDGAEFDFQEASSGESNILSTLIALIPLVEDRSLILIDEPEISLHPSWQYRYIDLIIKIFERVEGCHIIIASHSHFLVSDLPVNNSTVVTLLNEKGFIKSEMIGGSTYGWSAEDVLLNVFKLPTTRNFYLSQVLSEALELLADDQRDNSRLMSIRSQLSDLEPLMKHYDPLKKIVNAILSAEV